MQTPWSVLMRTAPTLLIALILACLPAIGCGSGGPAPATGGGTPTTPAPRPALLAGITDTTDAVFSHINMDTLGVDPRTGMGTLSARRIEGMAYDTNANVLYATCTANDLLFTIDRATGYATPVGPLGFNEVRGLAFDPGTNTLYGVDDQSHHLIRIDTTTGRGTAVSAHILPWIAGLAFDTTTNTLYASSTVGTGQLLEIDTATGVEGLVGSFPAGTLMHALAYAGGFLYGIDRGAQNLVRISPATASVLVLGSVGTSQAISLAWDDDTSTLWTCPGLLASVSFATGALTYGDALTARLRGLAYDRNTGRLYGTDGDSTLFRFDSADAHPVRVGPLGTQATGLAFDPATSTLYGTNAAGQLLTIDTATGAATVRGATGFFFLDGLAFDPNAGLLYAYDTRNDELISVNPATAAGTSIGVSATNVYVDGLAFDPATNTLYGHDDLADRFVTISTASGATTPLGPAFRDYVPALAFDEAANAVVGWDQNSAHLVRFDSAGVASGHGALGFNSVQCLAYDGTRDVFYGLDWLGALVRIDPDTGEGTATVQTAPAVFSVQCLAFDPTTDLLYCVSGTDLVSIEPDTGVVTTIGPTGFAPAIEGLAFDPDSTTLYGVSERNLVIVDTLSGTATDLGFILGLADAGTLRGLAWINDTVGLVATSATGAYVQIESTGPSGILIGSVDAGAIGALAYRPAED